MVGGWLLAACSAPPDPPSTPPPIEVSFTGVSTAYRARFSDPDAVATLGADLAVCTSEPVTLAVRYASGRGVVRLDGTWGPCSPVPEGDDVRLEALIPVSRALARYRNAIAAVADPRLATFRLEVGVGQCGLVPSGQFPPDGSTFAPCVADETETCEPGAEGVLRIRDDPLRSCLTRPGEGTPAPR